MYSAPLQAGRQHSHHLITRLFTFLLGDPTQRRYSALSQPPTNPPDPKLHRTLKHVPSPKSFVLAQAAPIRTPRRRRGGGAADVDPSQIDCIGRAMLTTVLWLLYRAREFPRRRRIPWWRSCRTAVVLHVLCRAAWVWGLVMSVFML